MPDHDEPKISPSVMKAAVGLLSCCIIEVPSKPTIVTYDVKLDYIAQIIDAATHLSDKETALRELVKACENLQLGGGFDALMRHSKALAKAKEALKP